MKRTAPILLAFGIGILLIGVTLLTLAIPGGAQTALAALPPDHPPIPGRPAGGITPILSNTTRADLFFPGTQPGAVDRIDPPSSCQGCHAGYSGTSPGQYDQPAEHEPWTGWQGSMMAQSARDPVFLAALDIAMGDSAFAGEFCLRCHVPRAWLEGRVQNGQLVEDVNETPHDREGVQCEVCHRLVDPITDPENPDRDLTVLAAITAPVTIPGNAGLIVDTEDYRRGPFDIIADLEDTLGLDPHTLDAANTLQSPFHKEAALCGSCHDISNPLLSWDEGSQSYQPNPSNQPFTDTTQMFPVERTYSEWLLSDYNTPQGVYAPEFGGNNPTVSTCQDCHMRAVTGKGAAFFGSPDSIPERTDLPLHDLTGGNTWVPQLLPLHPVFSATFSTGSSRANALEMGIERARTMLQNAAELTAHYDRDSNQLSVTVINQTGHKLPTGYVEGRRMWLQVEGYDANGALVYTSGAYDVGTGDLTMDADIQIYESRHGVTADWAAQLPGIDAGETFHFLLNNVILKDNRIPPRGFSFAEFEAAGAEPRLNGQPAPGLYADGQHWDVVTYSLPANVAYGQVRLLYQTSSKEYIEFLRDSSPVGGPDSNGQILFDLWQATNRSQPEVMVETVFGYSAFLPTVSRQ